MPWSLSVREDVALPIEVLLGPLVEALKTHPAVVVQAPPGAGKTTRVPGALLDGGILGSGRLIMLQPRRVAARAAAATLSRLQGDELGATVGYHIRFEQRFSAATRILVVTEGILTRRFALDPFLEGVSCVVLDEFHERSVHADLALAFLKELLTIRDDLKVVVMSATLDAAPVARFLGDCPVLTSEGRLYPVQVEFARFTDARPKVERMAEMVRVALASEHEGDILAFLPGAPEIRQVGERLGNLPGVTVLPLHGNLPPEEQDLALRPGGGRRVILSTNLAETSLTLEGVTTVIDSGERKVVRYDPQYGLERLETVPISRASSEQRAGRAGRVRPGRVLRLWTSLEHVALPAHDEPEILLTDLSSVLLQVMSFQPGDPRLFPFYLPPSPDSIDAALELLRELGAIGANFSLTPLGKRLLDLPLPPRAGALLVRAQAGGYGREGALLAALLAERDILRRGPGNTLPTTPSDPLWRLELLEQWEKRRFDEDFARRHNLDRGAARGVLRARDQLLQGLKRKQEGERTTDVDTTLQRALLAGWPDRVCRRRRSGEKEAVMVGGRGVALSPDSGVRDAPFFVALEVEAGRRGERSTSQVRQASAIDIKWLEEEAPHLIETREVGIFDAVRQMVVGVRRRCYLDLVLEEHTGVSLAPEVAGEILAREAALAFESVFQPDEMGRQMRARLTLAGQLWPDEEWPRVDVPGLKLWLGEITPGLRSFDDLRRLNWGEALRARLSWELAQKLDRELPPRLEVPSGSLINLDYEPALESGGAVVLPVRLQEVFGLAQSPRLAGGKLPLVLHLLSPALRPVQVTRDLASFWNTTYAEVRRELRLRYPKHAWPDDPWNAPPQARPLRRPSR